MSVVAPAFSVGIHGLNIVGPYIVSGFYGAFRFYSGLSSNMSTALYGFALSFFGGSFPVAIAVITIYIAIDFGLSQAVITVLIQAAEAFRVSGWDRLVTCITDVNEDFQLLLKASEEDDKKDDDKDGIADVDQMVRGPRRRVTAPIKLRAPDPARIQHGVQLLPPPPPNTCTKLLVSNTFHMQWWVTPSTLNYNHKTSLPSRRIQRRYSAERSTSSW
jgi:hypothetical protein